MLSDLHDSTLSKNERISALESKVADLNADCKASCTDPLQAYIDSRTEEIKAVIEVVRDYQPLPFFNSFSVSIASPQPLESIIAFGGRTGDRTCDQQLV
jgi:hypothetical protein